MLSRAFRTTCLRRFRGVVPLRTFALGCFQPLSRLPFHSFNFPVRSFSSKPAAADSPAPIQLTPHNFQQVVSDPTPLLIDCYADWCQPCKVLTPLLEKLVKKYKGKIRLALLDAQTNAEMATQLGVTTLPTVLGLVAGQMRDSFTGLIPEEKLVAFLDTLAGDSTKEADTEPTENSAEGMLGRANKALEVLLAASSAKTTTIQPQAVAAVVEMFENVSTSFPTFRAQAAAGIVQCYLLTPNGVSKAVELVASIRADTSKVIQKALSEPAVARAFALVDFNLDVEAMGKISIEELKTTLKTDTTNVQALYDLAVLSFVAGSYEEAVNSACKALTKNRQWKEGASKKLLQKMLAALGPEHALYTWARKRFANAVCL